jgi:putative Mn2+ efflux pump MntP
MQLGFHLSYKLTIVYESAIIYILSSNLDNVVVGIAYGIKKIKIGLVANLILSIITCTGTVLSMSFGIYISKFLPHLVATY